VAALLGCLTQLTIAEAFQKWGSDLLGYATVLVGPDAAPDVVSEALTLLLTSARWDQVDKQRGYLFRCVLNVARMHHRSNDRRRRRERRRERRVALPEVVDRHLDLSSGSSVSAVTGSSLPPELAALSPRQRAVVHLTYWEDMTPSIVAEVLGVSKLVGSARSRARGCGLGC